MASRGLDEMIAPPKKIKEKKKINFILIVIEKEVLFKLQLFYLEGTLNCFSQKLGAYAQGMHVVFG